MVLFFFNDTATTAIYTLSLHDALPIWLRGRKILGGRRSVARRAHPSGATIRRGGDGAVQPCSCVPGGRRVVRDRGDLRSEEHTSELQSHSDLVCRLLLEKKKKRRRAHK